MGNCVEIILANQAASRNPGGIAAHPRQGPGVLLPPCLPAPSDAKPRPLARPIALTHRFRFVRRFPLLCSRPVASCAEETLSPENHAESGHKHRVRHACHPDHRQHLKLGGSAMSRDWPATPPFRRRHHGTPPRAPFSDLLQSALNRLGQPSQLIDIMAASDAQHTVSSDRHTDSVSPAAVTVLFKHWAQIPFSERYSYVSFHKEYRAISRSPQTSGHG